jgi:O-antigen/teichoic acid export membrane protein
VISEGIEQLLYEREQARKKFADTLFVSLMIVSGFASFALALRFLPFDMISNAFPAMILAALVVGILCFVRHVYGLWMNVQKVNDQIFVYRLQQGRTEITSTQSV